MAKKKSEKKEASHGIPMMYQTGECGYFPEQKAITVITRFDWIEEESESLFSDCIVYNELAQQGFRRYNDILYSNVCENCRECIPIRIPVRAFEPSKSQRRIVNKNSDVEVVTVYENERFYTEEKIQMFREYYNRHNKDSKDYKARTRQDALEELKEMNNGYSGTLNLEYRVAGKLIGVSVIDLLFNSKGKIIGLSSNYFYYDTSPETLKRSIGVYSVLYEINYCIANGIPYYYLGLYLPHCRKMNYKINYKPYELFLDGFWTDSIGLEMCPEVVENYLFVKNDEALDPSVVLKFPEPKVLYDIEDICLVTSTISLQYLYSAYMQGVFPWFNEFDAQPVLWQSPEERFVIPIEELHVSKSTKKFLKHNPYTYTMDKAFPDVIRLCSEQKREGQNGSWIGPKIIKAYTLFHEAGYVHSFEVWHEDKLVGGFYGVLIGSIFCGESMFTIEPNSSKSAFVLFAQAFKAAGGKLIDCQSYTNNMARYGAKNISRKEYLTLLEKYKNTPLAHPIQDLL